MLLAIFNLQLIKKFPQTPIIRDVVKAEMKKMNGEEGKSLVKTGEAQLDDGLFFL